MRLMQRVATLGWLALALGCGGRDALQNEAGHSGSRQIGSEGSAAAGGSASAQGTSSNAGLQDTGNRAGAGGFGSAGSTQTGSSAGSQQTGSSAGSTQTMVGTRDLWLPHDAFDEISSAIIGSIKDFAVDASGNVYLASEASFEAEKYSFVLARVSAQGQLSWKQQISGRPIRMFVDDVGTIYQLRSLNQVGVLDRRTPDGAWVWSRELNETDLESSRFRMGKDSALYLGTLQGERLWKFALDGSVVWRWKGPGSRAIASVAADASGTVYLRTWMTPTATLPKPAKGQDSPKDGLFWTLDPSGMELSQRHYATESSGGTNLYIENGPVEFVLTQGGQLLSAAETSARLFDTAGNTLWKREVSDLKPALAAQHRYYLHSGLSAGRCGYCITSSQALLAFDAAGNQTEILQLDYEQEFGYGWAADQSDNIYVLARPNDTQSAVGLRRYHGGSGWKPVSQGP